MLCFVLAGGFATRLRNVIGDYPKPLIKIDDKTLLDYILSKVIDITRDVVLLINKRYEDSGRY